MGRARPPRAVASPLSLSPNQVVASLLEELMKNTYPRAATIVPMMATSNLPVIETSYLSQAPARVSAAPIMIYKEKFMMKAFTYCSSEAILVKDPNDDKIPRYECYQKYQGLKLHDDLRAIVNLPNCL